MVDAPSSRRSGRNRYVVPGLIVLLLVGGFPIASAGPPHDRPLAAPAAAPVTPGAGQLERARLSLEAGHGPRTALGPPASAIPSYRWSNITGKVAPAPSPRATMMTWDATDGYVLLFGGVSISGSAATYQGDTWTFLNGTWRNVSATVSGSPPPLAEGSMAYDAADTAVILFGGVLASGDIVNATWSYHGGVWTNVTHLSSAAPSPRGAPGFSYDSTDGELLLAGGVYNNNTGTPGTWTYKGHTWTNVTKSAPYDPKLSFQNLADDPPDHGVLMTAIDKLGTNFGPPYAEVSYLYSNGTWHNLSSKLAQEPPTLYVPSLAYVPGAHGDFLISGDSVNATGSFGGTTVTWEYSASAWTNLTARTGSQPAEGILPGVAVDPADNAVITFGRALNPSDNTTGETWVLAANPLVNASSDDARIDAGGSVAFIGAVADGVRPLLLGWAFGDGGNSTALSPSHPYTVSGLYLATLTATDFLGNIGEASVAVSVAALPSVVAIANSSLAVAGTPVELYAVVTGGTSPFLVAWNFGDGAQGSEAAVAHTFGAARIYHVGVNVTDAAGVRVSAEVNVTVLAAGSHLGPGGGSSSSGSTSGYPLFDLVLLLGLAVVAAIVGYAIGHRRGRSPPPPLVVVPPSYGVVPSGAAGLPPYPPSPPPG